MAEEDAGPPTGNRVPEVAPGRRLVVAETGGKPWTGLGSPFNGALAQTLNLSATGLVSTLPETAQAVVRQAVIPPPDAGILYRPSMGACLMASMPL